MTADSPGPFVPGDFTVPAGLEAGAFRLEPLGPQHNERDHQAWTSSIEHIRSTPGFADWSWPVEGMSLAENLADLERHAGDYARRAGFTYTVLAAGSSRVIGCVYIYPPRAAAAGAAEVRSWVRADCAELDAAVHDAVSAWLRRDWPFTSVRYAPRA